MSEIDDIFASKGKSKATSTHRPAPEPSGNKKKKIKRKDKQLVSAYGEVPKTESSKKRPAPETIVDPSVQISQKRQKVYSAPEKGVKAKSKREKEDEEGFKDSRGTGPRRKTEEGWVIYKEVELGIDPTTGDTPLCPFDCECSPTYHDGYFEAFRTVLGPWVEEVKK